MYIRLQILLAANKIESTGKLQRGNVYDEQTRQHTRVTVELLLLENHTARIGAAASKKKT